MSKLAEDFAWDVMVGLVTVYQRTCDQRRKMTWSHKTSQAGSRDLPGNLLPTRRPPGAPSNDSRRHSRGIPPPPPRPPARSCGTAQGLLCEVGVQAALLSSPSASEGEDLTLEI